MTAIVAEEAVTAEDQAPRVPETAEEEAIRASLSRGDARAAVARCARVYGAALGRFCMALLASRSEADEAVQETLLAAYDAAADFRGDGTVRAWLYGIARRICARRLEVRTRQARRRSLLTASADESDAVDEVVDQARRGAVVRAAVAELRPTEREALLLRYEGDLSYRDVAAACGIDEAAARQRVSRALAKVRARVESGK
jgi:RNA polymerase sigma-70 factor (ECF subfamily)